MAEQKTTTYTPRIIYNGKELPFKILLFLVLLILVFTSCKSQPTTTTSKNAPIKQAVADSVAYEIVKDSINCELYEGMTYLKFIKVKHPKKAVEGKINRFFVELNPDNYHEDIQDMLYDPMWKYNEGLKKNKDSLRRRCSIDNPSYGDIYEYDVTVNENHLLSIVARWEFYGYPRSNYIGYNFDLRTGNQIKTKDIIEDEEGFLKFLDQFNKEQIEQVLSELEKEKFAFSGIENAQEVWSYYDNSTYIPPWHFNTEKDKHGIYFDGFYYHGNPASELASINFFVPFEKLYNYCTDVFKARLQQDFNINNNNVSEN